MVQAPFTQPIFASHASRSYPDAMANVAHLRLLDGGPGGPGTGGSCAVAGADGV